MSAMTETISATKDTASDESILEAGVCNDRRYEQRLAWGYGPKEGIRRWQSAKTNGRLATEQSDMSSRVYIT